MAARLCSYLTISFPKVHVFQCFTYCSNAKTGGNFDTSLLDILVCPVSKEPLRYDEANDELVNSKLNIAYPIQDGIPNMNPNNARIIQKDTEED